MNRNRFFAAMAVCGVVLAAGCVKEDGVAIPEGAMTLNTEGHGTKASVSELSVKWVNGEKVKINGTEYTVVVADGKAYTSEAVADANAYYGYYPSSVAPATNGGAVTVPARYESSFGADGRQVIGLPMVAHYNGATNALHFKHLTAGMHVEVFNETDGLVYLDSVRVISATQKLNGSVVPDFSDADLGLEAATTSTASERMVTVTFGYEAVTIAYEGQQNVQVPILPIVGTTAKDLTVEVYTHSKAHLLYGEGLAPAAVNLTFSKAKRARAVARNQMSRAEVTIADVGRDMTVTDHSTFTINDVDSKVRFSQGNLQAFRSGGWRWKFATNQYDFIGNAPGNTIVTSTSPYIQYNATVDLFGWVGANSNYNDVPARNGVNASTAIALYSTSETNLKADWGTLAISNGGNTANSGWRTLSGNAGGQWEYIFNTRAASTVGGTENARYAKATVAHKAGVILFPDVYTHPTGVAVPKNINTADAAFTANRYYAADWAKMEAAGAVFLPAAGKRVGTTVSDVGSIGYYWSSTGGGGYDKWNLAYNVMIAERDIMFTMGYISSMGRNNTPYCRDGYSVRLVRDA